MAAVSYLQRLRPQRYAEQMNEVTKLTATTTMKSQQLCATLQLAVSGADDSWLTANIQVCVACVVSISA